MQVLILKPEKSSQAHWIIKMFAGVWNMIVRNGKEHLLPQSRISRHWYVYQALRLRSYW